MLLGGRGAGGRCGNGLEWFDLARKDKIGREPSFGLAARLVNTCRIPLAKQGGSRVLGLTKKLYWIVISSSLESDGGWR